MSLFHKNTLLGASGASGAAEALYVDDVFSIDVWDGSGAARDIDNDIDLSGEGGMAWIKTRTLSTVDHNLFDTERGAGEFILSNSDQAEGTNTARLSAFNSDGYSLGANLHVNGSSYTYVGWTFRKAPGFFDVVTWTGDGTSNRQISHNLGSTPGMITIKRLNSTSPWTVIHRSLSSISNNYLYLNESSSQSTGAYLSGWDSSSFTLGTYNNVHVNGSGDTYVAYVFAHDDQSFGTNGDEAIIKCGSYTGNGSTNGPEVDLGFEPQYLLIKGSSIARGWWVVDNLRGFPADSKTNLLRVNTTGTEIVSQNYINPTPTGFKPVINSADFNSNNHTYIYIAIRRPHKPPTAGTDVFHANTTGSGTLFTTGFNVDWAITKSRASGALSYVGARLTGNLNWLRANDTSAETTSTEAWEFDHSNSFLQEQVGVNAITWTFARAPGFFDVVAYPGTGADQVVNHNLGVTPELMILKSRSSSTAWRVFYKDGSTEKNLQLSSTGAANDIPTSHPWSPSATTFRADRYFSLSESGQEFIAYAFATLAGISKVGTYSGAGSSDVDVDCGFSAGARFVMIKRTDSSGGWYVWDTTRGIATGNDPYLELDSTAAETTNTDHIDPLNSGFTVVGGAGPDLNSSTGTYLFLAIA